MTFVLLLAFIFSLSWNVLLQQKIRNFEMNVHSRFKTDTIWQVDTFWRPEQIKHVIDAPEPVGSVNSPAGEINEYRDTTRTNYGWIVSNEIVRGQILSKKIEFEFSIPEYYMTRIVTNTTTRTVRNNLLYIDIGMSSDFKGLGVPLGATYIFDKHRKKISASYSLFNRYFEVTYGFNILK